MTEPSVTGWLIGVGAVCHERLPQGLAQPGTPRRPHHPRVCTRITQRLLTIAAALWHHWQTGAAGKRPLIACDHRTCMEALI